MSEVKKCPKCGGEMEKGRDLRSCGSVTLRKNGDWFADMIIPLYAKIVGSLNSAMKNTSRRDEL